MKSFGSNELLEDVIHKNLCIGCGACVELCPYFRSYRGKTAMLFPCTLGEGRCWAYCPKVEVDLEALSEKFFGASYGTDALGVYRAIHVAKAGPRLGDGSCQAGGTVSALMTCALEAGRIDAAVLTDRDGLLPVPRIVTEPADILRCASSKYAAAPTLVALNRAVSRGYRRIGVVGTPCQVLATAQMRSNPLKDPDFADPLALVVGLFCTWAIDFRALEPFIAQRVDIARVTKVDIPPPPAEIMEVYTAEERIEIPLEEVRELVPDSCSYCVDMTAEFSDVSVGVLEGCADRNTLVVRTERGAALVEEAVKEGWLVVEEMPSENLEHLIWAAGNKKRRAFLKARQEGMVNTAGDARACIRVNPDTVDKIVA